MKLKHFTRPEQANESGQEKCSNVMPPPEQRKADKGKENKVGDWVMGVRLDQAPPNPRNIPALWQATPPIALNINDGIDGLRIA